jgi:hypothetical protein
LAEFYEVLVSVEINIEGSVMASLNRPMKHISDWVKDKASGQNLFHGNTTDSLQAFEGKLVRTICEASGIDFHHTEQIEAAMHRAVRRSPVEVNKLKAAKSTLETYKKVKERLDAFESYESQAMSLERRASKIALFYRVVTTAAIGFVIMGIYALAAYWEVPMPLLRLPL